MSRREINFTLLRTECAEVVEVIRVVHRMGKGTQEDPAWVEASYWTKNGVRLAKMDINDDPMWPLNQPSAPSESSGRPNQ